MTGDSLAAAPVRRRAGLFSLFTAHGASSTGEAMTLVAVPWFVLQTTGSLGQTAVVVTAAAASGAVAGFLAGPWIDRLGGKRSSIIGYAASAGAMGTIPLLYALDLLSFGLLVLFAMLAAAFDSPRSVALSALVPGLAGAARMPLERANSGFRGISNLSALCGPALGGVAALWFGAHNVLLVDAAATALAALVIAIGVPAAAVPREAGPASAADPVAAGQVATPTGDRGASGGYLTELGDGVRTLVRTPLLRGLAATGAGHQLLDAALVGIVLVAMVELWWGDPATLGLLVSVFGLGALAGTIGYAVIGHRLPRRPVYAVVSLVVAVPVLGLAAAPPLPVAALAMAVAGALAAPRGPLTLSALQQAVPGERFGRTVTGLRVVTDAAGPLGIATAAVAIAAIGLPATLVVMAAGYALIGVACWRFAAFRGLDEVRARPAAPIGR